MPLSDRPNYWRILLPGTDAGVSVRCEVYSFLKDGQRLSLPVPCPAAPPDTGVQPLNPKLKFEHLLYLFGLAVPGQPLSPVGEILNVPAPYFIAEEEVPRAGRIVTRSFQRARGTNGSTCLWIGRSSPVGRGEGSSGLVFDQIDEVRSP